MARGHTVAHGLLALALLVALVPLPMARKIREYQKHGLRGVQAEEPPSGPTVKLTPQKLDVSQGQAVQLKCRVTGNPQPRIIWLKDNQEIGKEMYRYSIKENKKGSRLKISQAEEGDDGIYQCKASNLYGERMQEAALFVEGSADHEDMCLENSFCLNGGTCYYLKTIGAKFCKCAENFVGSRCEYESPFEIVQQVTDRDARAFDRTMTITGIILAVLVLAAICITAYCLAKQRREEYYKRKAERERYTKAQANGMPYQPVNQGDGATAKLNMPANPSPKSTHIEMKPSKSTVTQTDPDWLIGRETETSLCLGPAGDFGDDRMHASKPREKRHPPTPEEPLLTRARTPSGDKPRRSSLNTSVVNAVVESDHDSPAMAPRAEAAFSQHPRNRLRHEDSDTGSRGSRGSRDSKGNVSLEMDARSEYDNQPSDMEVNHESEVDMHALDQSGDDVKCTQSTESESDSESSSSAGGEEAALFEQLKKKNPQILEMDKSSPPHENDNEPWDVDAPYFAPFHPPNNYALKSYANKGNHDMDNKKSLGKRNHKHRKDDNLQERIMKELQDDTDATPV